MEIKPISSSTFYGQRYKTLGQAIETIISKDDDTPVDIVLIPPEVDIQTDEEDFDDDNLFSSSIPKDVPGEVELVYHSDDEEDNIPLTMLRDILNRTEENTPKKIKNHTPIWSDAMEDIEEMEGTFTPEKIGDIANTLKNSTPVEIFEKLLDDTVIDHIVDQSVLYAGQKNSHSFSVTREDIKIFLGVLLYSGYHKLPRERLYWSLDEDLNTDIVYNAISKNRYCEIKRNLHFADNTALDKDDKMAKLRPLMNLLNKNFQQWGIFSEKLSIDEAMVKYFGHHSSKQFLIKKPVRFGYKNWMMCSSTGYCFAFDTYCGAKANQPMKENKLPLGSTVVLDLLKVVPRPSDHIVFFFQFFHWSRSNG